MSIATPLPPLPGSAGFPTRECQGDQACSLSSACTENARGDWLIQVVEPDSGCHPWCCEPGVTSGSLLTLSVPPLPYPSNSLCPIVLLGSHEENEYRTSSAESQGSMNDSYCIC